MAGKGRLSPTLVSYMPPDGQMSRYSNRRPDSARGVPILLYHRVSDDPAPGLEHYCVSPANFRRQMAWLQAGGYETILLDTLVDHYTSAAALPARPVVITFDDGYRDNLDNAYPVLESLSLRAIIFLVAGAVGRKAGWDAAFGAPPSLLSWPEIRMMAKGPITFGAHTINHPHLCQITAQDAWNEISGARTILEDGLGHEVSSFAYPYSDFSEEVRGFVARAGYRAACSSIWGLSTSADDVYALRRLIVGGGDSLESFARKVSGTSGTRRTWHPVLSRIKRFITRSQSASTGGSSLV